MSHRVTLKDLQQRLDEMKEQRDEARKNCTRLEEEVKVGRRKLDDLAQEAREVALCHDILDAYTARDPFLQACRPMSYVARAFGDQSMARERLSYRLNATLFTATLDEGRLRQADVIRREGLPPCEQSDREP